VTETRQYRIAQSLRQACAFLSISPSRVLARCGLPRDFLENEGRGVDARTWFSIASALAQEVDDPGFPLKLGRAAARGPFQPALLAFSSSPDIATGLNRLKLFKPLVAPITLVLREDAEAFSVGLCAAENGVGIPPVTATMEIVFFLELARYFSAHPIKPRMVTLPDLSFANEAFRAFVGCPVKRDTETGLVMSMEDARRPLVSADAEFSDLIERELLARLGRNRDRTAVKERVRRELIDMLPSGRISIGAVCARLRTSKRSLQRKLKGEGASFQAVLDETRASLAFTYLRDRKLSVEETSYLLAYRDPNSFYRAFHDWTGMTPAQARMAPVN